MTDIMFVSLDPSRLPCNKHTRRCRPPDSSSKQTTTKHANHPQRKNMTSTVESEISELRTYLAQSVDPSFNPPVAQARLAQYQYGASVPLPADTESTTLKVGGIPAVRIRSGGASDSRALLLFHSGGYSSGDPADHAALAAHLAIASNATGYVPQYRRAPEDPFPAAVEDAAAAYRGLLETGFPADKIVVAGDSAGGGLAIAVAQQAVLAGLPAPAGVYAMSPWADLTQTNPSYDIRGPHDPMLSRTSLHDLARMYLNGADPRSPLASPVFGDFTNFPPLLLHVGTDEVLLGDTLALAREAAHAGSDVTLRVWAQMIHIFPWFHPHLQTGQAAIAEAGTWIGRLTA
ncbi:alpha/beta hydrolase [Streptomyces sp. DSM 41524]|uniref:Alpha/beta hydrolase n=1 Tax=Streptomyces asiaticus subsp. ignotus TaxID=3098222 RepID=A0ABU7QBW4_9ACTN|nr:alpha/beta hydrolase [Streptomyces sp. DSM 41524]